MLVEDLFPDLKKKLGIKWVGQLFEVIQTITWFFEELKTTILFLQIESLQEQEKSYYLLSIPKPSLSSQKTCKYCKILDLGTNGPLGGT